MAERDKDDLISIIEDDEFEIELPDEMPLMPVRDVVIFTDMLLPLFIGRKQSVRAVEEAAAKDGFLMLCTQRDPGIENPRPEDIYELGTIGRVLRILKLPDGRIKVLIQGISKGKVKEYTRFRSFYRTTIDAIEEPEPPESDVELEALMRNVKESSEEILSLRGELSGDVSAIINSIDDPGKLADLVASNLRLKLDESQEVLECIDPVDRLKRVNEFLSREVALSAMQAKIQSNVKYEISKTQRDYYLREQMRAIHRELGEVDDRHEIDEYIKRIKKSKMPKYAKEEADKQLKRLDQMHPESAEATIIRSYMDWLVDIPWEKATKDYLNIAAAKKVLDENHYGLDKIKDRILEYLSVRKLNAAAKGPIICFVGPPGVGKTSLGRAVAKAMKRKFHRISLGGVRDEAEIRGHRRTYIGALPGRIIQGLKQCGVKNPVFMMDEIDKLGSDFRGDPSSALLEALDPEQNSQYSDHFLNIPFDLAKVMFILTANMTDTIPYALLDRMEIIRLPGYAEDEKMVIAEKHLLPRQIKENGLKPRQISVSKGAVECLINEYTFESGVRNLEREIGSLCRKVARRIAEGEKGPFNITRAGLQKYLGVSKYYPEMDQEESQVGLSTGLAWTEAGGDVLYIEVSMYAGKGELIITGQLGEVMQESARAAMTYARANMALFGVPENVFDTNDIHIHVPAGAVPKDGPSAGIAMATALISALTEQPVDKYVAMTGEITLRGRVLPIGGLKEKALGAIRGGIRTVIIPEKNKKELSELPKSIKRKLTFVTAKNIDEVFPVAFGDIPRKKKVKKKSVKSKK